MCVIFVKKDFVQLVTICSLICSLTISCVVSQIWEKNTYYLVLSAFPVTDVLRSGTAFKAADTVYTVMLLRLYQVRKNGANQNTEKPLYIRLYYIQPSYHESNMNDSSRTNRHWINYSIKTNYSCETNYLSETNFSSKINYSDIPFQVDCKEVSYSAVHGSLEHAPNYILHIHPPAILHNYLPYNIHYASPVSSSNEMSGCL